MGGGCCRLWFLCSKSSFCCQNDETGLYSHLSGVPKALLPGIGGKKILDFWWETVNMCVSVIHMWSTRDPHVIRELSCSSSCHWRCLCVSRRQLFTAVYLVTNADKWVAAIARIGWCLETLPSFCFSFHSCSLTRYKHYERWATASDFPVENIINDGSTTLEDRLGAVADLELVVRSRKLQDDIMVVIALSVANGLNDTEQSRTCYSAFLLYVSRLLETCCVQTKTLTLLKLFASSGQRWEFHSTGRCYLSCMNWHQALFSWQTAYKRQSQWCYLLVECVVII